MKIEFIDKLTDEELLKEYEVMNQLINGKVCCYGTKDVIILHYIEQQIRERRL